MDVLYYGAVSIVYDNWCPLTDSHLASSKGYCESVSQVECTLGLEAGSRDAATPVDELSGTSNT